jgi:P27 family predicted phage terminase small subunit
MSYKKPPKMKVIQGTDQPCRRKSQNKPDDNLPLHVPAPEYLEPPGRRKWNQLVRQLRKKGMLDSVDLGALEACCLAYDEMVACQIAIKKSGGIVGYTEGKSSQQVPLLTAKNKAMDTYKKYMGEFGLSPASRARMGYEGEAEKSEFEKYLEKIQQQA